MNHSKGTILIISPWENRWSLGAGAGVSDDDHFIKGMTAAGYDLHFLAPKGRIGGDGVQVHHYPNFFKPTASWTTAARRVTWPTAFNTVVTPAAIAAARRIQPDLVLGHSHYSALPAYMVRELFQIPSVVKLFGVMDLVHSEWPKQKYYAKNIEQIAALKVPQDGWIILDDGTRGNEAALRHGVPREKLHFLPNGIDLEWAEASYDRNAVRDELGIAGDATVVLFLARLVASKRPEALIQAARDIVQADDSIVFVFAGDGDRRADCERLTDTLGLAQRVHFIGSVPHERVPHVMTASDIFVSTSSLTNAAIPTAEAMVCGLPVVAYDVGNTSDIIIDNSTGKLVADGDTQALATTVVELARNPVQRHHLGESGRALARDRFMSWDRRISLEREILESLIRRARETRPS